jgi:DNA-directed RNA polymerase specialized sigma24 family protein
MNKTHKIKIQRLNEKAGNTDSYTRWLAAQEKEDHWEPAQANPDMLQLSEALYADGTLTDEQELMGIAIEHLQGRQKQVYLLTMREGLSLADTAKSLNITKSTAQVYRTRAIAFIKAYCQTITFRE